MKKFHSFFLFLLVPFCGAAQDFVKLNGIVTDARTGEPLSFVNIVVCGKQQGTTTDIDGKFRLVIPAKTDSLCFSFVGYSPAAFDVHNYRTGEKMVIRMHRLSIPLKEVSILPGENPAHRIIDRVVENRRLHDPDRLPSYSYTSYNKFVCTADKFSIDTIAVSKSRTGSDSARSAADKYFDTHHLFLMESVTEKKFLHPSHIEETVTGSRVSGFKDATLVLLATQIQSFSFYKETITISDKNYLNPVSPGSEGKYLFVLEDTIYSGADTVFIISFAPRKGKNFDALKGLLYINTDGYAVQNVIAEPVKTEQGISIRIQQQYEKISGRSWFPVQLNTDLIFNNVMTETGMKIVGLGRTYLKNITIGDSFRKRDFSNIALEYSQDALARTDEFWQQHRADSLDAKDKNTYRTIDSLGNKHHFDRRLKTFETVLSGKYPAGIFDIDLERFLSYNDYEGFRPGLGLHTSRRLSKFISIGGYAAYGFRDKGVKYGYDLSLFLWKKADLRLNALWSDDVAESGGVNLYDNKKIAARESFRQYLIQNMDKVNQQEISVTFRFLLYVTTKIFLNNSTKSVTNEYRFDLQTSAEANLYSSFDFTETGFSLRYAFREKLAYTTGQYVSLGTPYPVLWLQVKRGIKNFMDGMFDYTKTDVKISWSVFHRKIGRSHFQLQGGFVNGDIPYPNLYNGNGSYKRFSILTENSFQTMGMNEFMADRYVSLFHQHSFGKLLLRIKKFQPEFIISNGVQFGTLTNTTRHFNVAIRVPAKGYYESGLIVANIIRSGFVGMGAAGFYRYGAYSHKKQADNFIFKAALTINL